MGVVKIVTTVPNVERTNLVGSHRKRVDVTPLHSGAACHFNPPGINLFRCHITNYASPAGCCAALRGDEGIGDDFCDLKISDARRTFRSNQNIPLDRNIIIYWDARSRNHVPLLV